MKPFHYLLIATMLVILTLGNSIKANAQQDYYDRYDAQYGASYQDFYDGLSPYGQWLYDPMYGYVWLPNVGPDFRPYYTNGYWAMTQYGNTWVSNYDWGWAPFHYGRWTFDNYYGWLWIPDTQWAPAWVSWRSNQNYYGWAPMGPGVGINISLSLIPTDWWIFLSPNYFYETRFQRYCNIDWAFNRNIYRQTTYINNSFNNNSNSYYTGPRADDYRRRTGRQPSVFNIENNDRRGSSRISGNRINMYRPSINKIIEAAPRKIVQTERGISQRPQANNNAQPVGRQWVLNQTASYNTRSESINKNRTTQPDAKDQNAQNKSRQYPQQQDLRNVQYQREQNAQIQQRNEQLNRQNIEQQRLQQQEQSRRQQQQREEENRQRTIQGDEANKQRNQQHRDAQINQQREQENNRARQQQQNQMEQQRRMQQPAPPPREQRPQEPRPMMNEQRNNKESSPSNNTPRGGEGSGTRRR